MRPLPQTKLRRRAVIGACACLVAALLPGGALADRKVAIGAAELERLLSRIKVQYPSASILKVEREAEGDGARGVYAVTLLQLPTAFFNELAHHLTRAPQPLPACLRAVVIGGERANHAACKRFRAVAPQVRLFNAYGPTEVTITATCPTGMP